MFLNFCFSFCLFLSHAVSSKKKNYVEVFQVRDKSTDVKCAIDNRLSCFPRKQDTIFCNITQNITIKKYGRNYLYVPLKFRRCSSIFQLCLQCTNLWLPLEFFSVISSSRDKKRARGRPKQRQRDDIEKKARRPSMHLAQDRQE